MTNDNLYETKLTEYLNELSLPSLRALGRHLGLSQTTSQSKSEVISAIVGVLSGKIKPTPPSKRGAPAKQTYLSPEILETLDKIKAETLKSEEVKVATPEGESNSNYSDSILTGILELTAGGYGFLRTNNCQPSSNGGDVFIPSPVIHSLRLREGDELGCTAKPRTKNDSPAMNELLTVNGINVPDLKPRPIFDSLTACYPNKQIKLSGTGDLSMRVLDLFIPIGRGQRALIIAPPKAGKTTLLKKIAQSVVTQSEYELIVLLIDERPEEVTDFRTDVAKAKVVYSTFDEGADHHVRAAELTIAHAKRLAELGRHVVILLDSLTKLTRAYNYIAENTGKTLSGGLDASALAEPKRFFGAARNTVERGSITILATALVDTGSRMDDVIYEEFKGTGNADIFLSRELAERRVFPAIDIRRSGTRKEELLLPANDLAAVYKMRERGLVENAQGLYEMMKRTPDNGEFVSRLPEWMKIYKSVL